ncbi:MAG: glycosyltransferase family A protein [Pseudomonadota bacterium]
MYNILRRKPYLSIILIVYKMPDQADKTLYSLSPAYQRGAKEKDYEVIVVENSSDNLLGAERATRHARNVRYFCRDEVQRTPVHAINFGASKARGTHLAIMIDGARMVSPGVVHNTLQVFRMAPKAAVSTLGYHIGHKLQQVAINEGYDETEEAKLLQGIRWPEDGYRLFEIAVLSGSCQGGFFKANSESNFIAMTMRRWNKLGGMDSRYNDFGGGNANLDLYKRLLGTPGIPFYLLFGEGSFHQFHGGVTTGTRSEERTLVYKQLTEQDIAIRGHDREAPNVRPILFGAVHPSVYRFIRVSLDKV